jgi:hypothetical protein
MERESAMRVNMFMVKPNKVIRTKVPKSEVGMAKKILRVEDQLPRKK